MRQMQDAIGAFLHRATGHRQPFSDIYEKLEGQPFGIRAGVIPIYLAYMLSIQYAMPCVYLKNKEVPLNGSTMQLISEDPESYWLYVEAREASKMAYLKELSRLFCPEWDTEVWNGELKTLVERMQGWYQGLPQYSRVGTLPAETKLPAEQIKAFRRLFRFGEPNPREWLLEELPKALDSADALEEAADRCREMKQAMESFLPDVKRQVAEETKALFGIRKDEDLLQSLQVWCRQREGIWQQKVLSASARAFLDEVFKLYTHEELQIVNGLSKAVLDLYMESWNDGSKAQYFEQLQAVQAELSEAVQNEESAASSVIFIEPDGSQMQKQYTVEEDSSMVFLKNALQEVMEEFGDALTENQRVNVLMDLLKEHI